MISCLVKEVCVQHLFGERLRGVRGMGEEERPPVFRLSFVSHFPCRSALAPCLYAPCKKTHINCIHLPLKVVWGPSAIAPSFPLGVSPPTPSSLSKISFQFSSGQKF